MAGTAVFQSGTLATPGPGIVVAVDPVQGTLYQQVKIDVGPAGTSVPVSYASGTGLPVQGLGTFQALGTFQPLAGSVHLASGTVQVLGSVQPVGTAQALGTFQPLAGSVHLASGTVTVLGTIQAQGTTQVLGSVQTVGTSQVLGTTQPLAGSVHVANTLPGTVQVLGSVQTVGTSQALGTFQPLAGSVHLASGTVQILGSVQAVGTTQTKEVRAPGAVTSSVAATVGNIILLAANPARLGFSVYLDGGSALYLKLGSNAGTLDYTLQIAPSGYYEVPFNYTGTVTGIWQFTGGTARITEVS